MAEALHTGTLTAERCGSGGRERIQRNVAGRSVEAAEAAEAAMTEVLFKVVRINSTYEVLARAANLMIARGAYREAARMYPDDRILFCEGTQVIEKSK
jgi:hypothetical protein